MVKRNQDVLPASEKLREWEERFRQLAENINEAFWLTDWINNKVLYVSPGYERIWGRSSQSLINDGKSWSYNVHPDDRKKVVQSFRKNASSGKYDEVYRIIRDDGQIRWIHDRAFPILDKHGRVYRVAGLSEDITSFKNIEEELRRSKEHLETLAQERSENIELVNARLGEAEAFQRAIFEGSTDPVIITDLNDTVKDCNPAVEHVFGYKPEELLGKTFPGLEGIDEGKFKEWVEACRSSKGISSYETLRQGKDGRWIPVSITVSPVRDANGELRYLSFLYHDITERKRAEEEAKRRSDNLTAVNELAIELASAPPDVDLVELIAEKLKHITGAVATIISLFDHRAGELVVEYVATKSKILEKVNELIDRNLVGMRLPVKKEVFERARVKVAGKIEDISVMSLGVISKPLAKTLKSIFSIGDILGFVLRHEDKITGSVMILMPVEKPSPGLEVMRAFSDVVAVALSRKKAEDALRESEEKYRSFVERANEGIAIIQDVKLRYVNPRLATLLGYEVEEMTGTSATDYVLPDEKQRLVDLQQRRMNGEDVTSVYETVLRSKEGKRIEVEVNVGRITYGGRPASLVLYRDITERKRVQETLMRRAKESAVLAELTRKIYTAESLDETFKVAVKHLARVFPAYITANQVEDGGKFLVVKAHHVERGLLAFAEKLVGLKFANLKLPLYEDTVISQAIYSGHPLISGLDFEPKEPVVKTEIPQMLAAMVERKSPLRVFVNAIAERIGKRSVVSVPFSNARGEVIGSVTVMTDYSLTREDFNLMKVVSGIIGQAVEQQLLHSRIRESEEQFRGIYENSTIGLYRTTPDGRILMANPAILKMLGYSSFEELVERNLEQKGYEPAYPRSRFKECVERDGEVIGLESAWKRRDGTTVFVRENARVIRDTEGRVLYYEGTVEDITEHKRAEEALQQERKAFEIIAQAAVKAKDVDDICELVMDGLARNLGFEVGSVQLYNEKDRKLYLKAAAGAWKHAVGDEGMVQSIDDLKYVGTHVARTMEPVFAPDVTNHEMFETFKTRLAEVGAGVKALITWPIVGSARKLLGIIQLVGWEPKDISFDKRSFVETVIEMFAVVLEHKRSEEALRGSEERFRSLVENLQEGLIIHNVEDSHIIYANRRAAEMFGFSTDDILAKSKIDMIKTVVHEDDLEDMLDSYRTAVELRKEGVDEVVNLEYRIRKKNGEIHWIDQRSHPIHYGEKDNNLCYVIFSDVTERKQTDVQIKASLAEKEVLLKEIHHRVKNNLQVVSSLLKLQMEHSPDEKVTELLREGINRIKAIALIHEKLYRSADLARVDFAEYIKDLVSSLLVSHGTETERIKVSFDIGEISLGIDKAIPCALIINELVSNSLEHAFSGDMGGLINLVISSADDHYELKVSDNGVGLPEGFEIKHTETLGLQLVETLVAQLKGDIHLKNTGGVTLEIKFPAGKSIAVGAHNA